MEPLAGRAAIVAGLAQGCGRSARRHWDRNRWIMTTDTIAKAATRRVVVGDKTITITGISRGRRHDPSEYGDDARLRCHRRRHRAATAAQLLRRCRRILQLHHGRWRHRPTIHSSSSPPASQARLSPSTRPPAQPCATPRSARWPVELAPGHRATVKAQPSSSPSPFHGGQDRDECRKVGYAIGHSPLVKTAFFASDPNLGASWQRPATPGFLTRMSTACGSGSAATGEEILVAENGGGARATRGRWLAHHEECRRLPCVLISVAVRRLRAQSTRDFSYDYVKINADYRS